MAVMSIGSIVGRTFFSSPIVGDYELVQTMSAIAVAMSLPFCQMIRGHIIVDFFTSKCSAATNHRLDRMGDIFMAVIFGLLSWRCALGAINAKETMGASMLLGFPDWIVFTSMCIPFGITALIALMQALSQIDHNEEATA